MFAEHDRTTREDPSEALDDGNHPLTSLKLGRAFASFENTVAHRVAQGRLAGASLFSLSSRQIGE
jgi:hypothetical protein